MKTLNIQRYLFALISLLFSAAIHAAEDNTLYANKIACTLGTTEITLPLYLNNSQQVTGVQFDLYLPTDVAVAYKTNRNGVKSYATTITKDASRFRSDSDHSISCLLQPDGAMRIILSSVTNQSIIGDDICNSSPLLNIKLSLSSDLQKGNYPIELKRVVLSSYNGSETTKYECENFSALLMVNKDGIPDVDPEPQTCSSPTITIIDGRISVQSETEGSKCHVKYDVKTEEGTDDTPTFSLIISAYATADGYTQSETTTKTVPLSIGQQGDMNSDGKLTIEDVAKLVDKIKTNK